MASTATALGTTPPDAGDAGDTDEQLLIDAARTALRSHDTFAAARAAIDGSASASLWPTAVRTGFAGLLTPESSGGGGGNAYDALIVLRECGRVLADLHLVGHLPATAVLASAPVDDGLLARLATGEGRACFIDARAADPTVDVLIDGDVATLTGTQPCVLDGADADVLVVAVPGGTRCVVVDTGSDGVDIRRLGSYSGARNVGEIRFDGAQAGVLRVDAHTVTRAAHLQQLLLGSEALGVAEACLDGARRHALDRWAFGRPIGANQAIKHALVEMYRRVENARAIGRYAAWAWTGDQDNFSVTAMSFRYLADLAAYLGSREAIFVLGAIGVTWEHDASLYYRHAELTRRLLGGSDGAARAVGDHLLERPSSGQSTTVRATRQWTTLTRKD